MSDTLPSALEKARARARQAPVPPLDLPESEGLRRAVHALLPRWGLLVAKGAAEAVPQPETRARLDDALAHLASLYEVSLAAPAHPANEPGLASLRRGLEAAGRALGKATDEQPDLARRAQLEAERLLAEVAPFSDQAVRPTRLQALQNRVYDRDTGRSRYDPQEEDVLVYSARCPREACAASHQARLYTPWSTHRVSCPTCHTPYTLYVGVVLGAEHPRRAGAPPLQVEVREADGTRRTLGLPLAAPADRLGLSRGDLLVVTYDGDNHARRVQGGTPDADQWLPAPARCFVVTAAMGPFAPELTVLRRWRDERLRRHLAGRAAVAVYERVGPTLARGVSHSPALKSAVRVLARAVAARVDRPLDPRPPRG